MAQQTWGSNPLTNDDSHLRTRNNICKKFLHRTCDNSQCPYLHDNSKVRLCGSFLNTGYCSRADLCDFSHRTANSGPSKTNYACKQFQEFGYCEDGERCPYKHVRRVCRNYERGFCQLGSACPDVHQEMEIPCTNYFLGFCPEGPSCKFTQ